MAPDVVFIGAGINALGAAYELSQHGWRVLVLERNDAPGGAMQTQELTLPGFRHDLGPMNLNLLAGSPFYRRHREVLAAKGVELVVADRAVGSVFPGGRFLGIGTDEAETLRHIGKVSRADAQAWQAWIADFDRHSPHLFRTLGSPAPVAVGQDDDAQSSDLRALLSDSLRAHLGARFESEEVRALIAAWGLHPDYGPDIAGGCWFPFIETNTNQRQGIAIAKGGSGVIPDALADLIQDAGGEVRTGASVDRILIEQGRAVGVDVAGEEIRAKRAVVAGVTPAAMLILTKGQLPAPEEERARSWRHGVGTFMIHLALSDPPPWRAPDAQRSFYVHIGPSLDHLARVYQESLAGLLSAEPFCVVGQPTRYDPSRAPAGKHVLWIMVRCVPAVIEGDAAGRIEGPVWTGEVKEAFADRVLDLTEDHAPGLRGNILARALHAPPDLEALNPNLVAGDINGGSCHLDQFYGHRPFASYAHHRMPIEGLYMCGASTWRGPGASPGSGTLVAQQLLRDFAA